jgi:LCP family protein required for cell wall assembly
MSALILALCTAACNAGSLPDPAVAPPPTFPDRPATSPPTTTTTEPDVFELEGAPAVWQLVVAGAYGRPCDGDRFLLPLEIAALEEAITCPASGITTTASLGEWTLAVTEVGNDVFYGVGGDAGWNLVAARIPSLGQVTGWYGVIPKIVAAVGSDARPGQEPERARADSIHLLALDGQGAGGILGVPRDSWVTISGGGTNKVNASLSNGGAEVMLQTLADMSGLNLDGYVLTGFTGFEEMLGNVLGGVDIDLPSAVIDTASGADLSAGPHYLNGPQALALARARKSLANGDITRSLNGGMLLLAALSSVKSYGPRHLPELIVKSAPWITTDLSLDELLSFAALALDTPLDAIGNAVVPGRIGRAGRFSVVYLTDRAPQVFADIADGNLAP